MVRPSNPSRTTRASSGHKNKLAVKITKTKYGDRSFSVSSAKLWNELPGDIALIEETNVFKK
jgi:hypothetical protein